MLNQCKFKLLIYFLNNKTDTDIYHF